jgi:hypothetical protein
VRSVCGLLYVMQYVSSALFLTASGNDCSIFYLILFFAQVSLVTIRTEHKLLYIVQTVFVVKTSRIYVLRYYMWGGSCLNDSCIGNLYSGIQYSETNSRVRRARRQVLK